MDSCWILTANAGRARIFAEPQPGGALVEVNDMVNPAVRMRTADTETDRLGPTSAGKSIHNTGGATPNKTYEPPQTPAEHDTELFARSVCGFLQQAHQDERFRTLVLTASPQFLGLLRKLLSPQLQALVSKEVNKDFTQSGPVQLREQIGD
jgi:protein required for attachment to host cells